MKWKVTIIYTFCAAINALGVHGRGMCTELLHNYDKPDLDTEYHALYLYKVHDTQCQGQGQVRSGNMIVLNDSFK